MARNPYTNFHDLNLNWIIEKIKTVFTPDNPPPYPVTSVNQKTGAVNLKGTDIPVSANDQQNIAAALSAKYVKPSGGIPASDLAPGVIPDPTSIIDDNAGSQVYNKTWSAHKLFQQEADILDLQNDKQDAPAAAGTAGQVLGLNSILQPEWVDMPEAQMIEAVDEWLSENITNPSNPPLDRSLSLANACAPADMVGDINKAVAINDQNQIYGLRYGNLTIPNDQTYVSSGNGSIAVYPIDKFDKITIDITYSAEKFINRDGLAFSDNPFPTPNETIFRINNTAAVSADTSISFINPGYKYFYIYYSNAITQAGDPNTYLKVTKISGIPVPDGYEEVFPTWRQGGFAETTASNRILSSYIDTDPIGRNWIIVAPDGYMVNIGAYSVYKTGDTDSPNEHVYSTLQTGIIEPSKTNNFFRGKFRILGAKTGNANLNYKADAVFRVFRQKTDAQYMKSNYAGKTVSLMGDSITTYGSIDDAGNTGVKRSPAGNPYTYPGNVVRYPQTNLNVVEPEQTYWLKTIVNLNMNLGINESIAGSTVAWDGVTDNGTNYGSDYCMCSYTRIGHLNANGTPDIIIINGGTNDPEHAPDVPIGDIDYTNPTTYTDQQIAGWSDPTSEYFRINTFCGAYQTMLIRMMKAYPLAKIICLLPNFGTYTVRNIDNYCEAIKEMCDLYGIKWIDIRTSGVTPFNKGSYLNDGLHPNYKGMQLIGDKLTKSLLFDV